MREQKKSDLDIDVYRDSYSLSELQQLRKKLAKRANQRILRLERSKSKITGEKFNTFGAVIDIYHYLGERTRFREQYNAISDINSIRREITVLQGFLGRKTSLVSGIREIERKRINTFESGKWGYKYKKTGVLNKPLHFSSTKEFYDFLNSETFRGLLSSGFTSEQLIDIYDSARVRLNTEDDIVANEMSKALDEYRSKGNASLKDLKNRLNSITIKDSRNK